MALGIVQSSFETCAAVPRTPRAMRPILALAGVSGALGVSFSGVFGDFAVLQREPSKAALFGDAGNASSVIVTLGTLRVQATVKDGRWHARLPAQPPGGDWTITASGGNATAELRHVTFGDVWYCSGQSNMALPLQYTMSRHRSLEAIQANKYGNIRIHGMSGNMNPTQPWAKVSDAIRSPSTCDKGCAFFKYSSTCWYFAESLSDRLGDVPLGMIHTAWGGSTIEEWLDNKTIASCRNATITSGNQQYHDKRVLPYVDMALKGWIWYQGENDMHGVHGNSALGYGYGCLAQRLVSSWRSLWRQPEAPFGFVTLAPSGSEGGNSMGAMRWAQTANFGVAPNPAMPFSFMAQAFDLNDPFSNITCYRKGCCSGSPHGDCNGCGGPGGYCANLSDTNYYMGPIHPRDKKPVAARLAQAALVVAYGAQGSFTGPTLAGCRANGENARTTTAVRVAGMNVHRNSYEAWILLVTQLLTWIVGHV
ncbi:unnamed protein product [Effrenium voratum]|nr:unnamed protein product [Effrenium voratum]